MVSQFNVAILGKTGVGKSSLINYLLGENRRVAGTGKPQTGRGLHKEPIELMGVQGTLFDSWGLEPDKSEEWKAELQKELAVRGIQMPISEWFHTILYCIQASGHRVEPIDVQIIRQFLSDNYRLVVVFTKADLLKPKDIQKMRDALIREVGAEIPVVPICSEEKVLLGNRRTERSGREALVEEIHNHVWESILLRLPNRCEAIVLSRIEQFYEGWKLAITEETHEWNLHEMYNRLNKAAQEFDVRVHTGYFSEIIVKEMTKTFEVYGHVFEGIGALTPAKNVHSFEWKRGLDELNEFWSSLQGALSVVTTMGISLIWAKENNRKTLMKYLDEFCERHRQSVRENVKPLVREAIEQHRAGKVHS
jgi:tRNA U34 5-carboxymethylaminomethyl modifying GTPase MnmE/TrmE